MDGADHGTREGGEELTETELLERQRELAGRLRSAAGAPAPAGMRLLAFGVDLAAWAAAFFLPVALNMGIVELLGGDPEGPATAPGACLSFLLFWCYVPLCTYVWQATPGKLACRLRVIKFSTGEPVSAAHAWARFLLHGIFASICWGVLFLVDHLWLLGDEGRTLHDKATGTTVIQLPKPPAG
jgi:uncharacterized RDD family membrane protein YckC